MKMRKLSKNYFNPIKFLCKAIVRGLVKRVKMGSKWLKMVFLGERGEKAKKRQKIVKKGQNLVKNGDF